MRYLDLRNEIISAWLGTMDRNNNRFFSALLPSNTPITYFTTMHEIHCIFSTMCLNYSWPYNVYSWRMHIYTLSRITCIFKCASRPASSFMWFTNPVKMMYFILWQTYKKHFFFAVLLIFFILFAALFLYALPGYTVKRVLGAWGLVRIIKSTLGWLD